MSKAPGAEYPRILIVDDDRDDHELLNMAFHEVIPGASVTSFYNGEELMDFLLKKDKFAADKSKRPQLIFLDLNMSRVGGREATYLLKKDPELKKITIIILTTSSDMSEKEELLRLGAEEFYTKPDDLKELVKIVKEVNDKYLNL